jgi:hypothetical protein
MKHNLAFFLLALLCSCRGNIKIDTPDTATENDWLIADSIISLNTYSKSGLLDTTYETTYLFQSGLLDDSVKGITTRQYDKTNLIHEKGFDLNENGQASLFNEILKKYDLHNNLISEVIYVKGELRHSIENRYNPLGEKTETIYIDLSEKRRPNKNAAPYDTSLHLFKYDSLGNIATTIITDNHIATREITTMTYDGKNKKQSYTRSIAGDTLSRGTFMKENEFDKAIMRINKIGLTDTTWSQYGKVCKSISYNTKTHSSYKATYTFNLKGDETASLHYKR